MCKNFTRWAFAACLTFAYFTGMAQNQIPDGDFESWASDALNLYENPASGWWATLNPLRNLGGPVTVAKSSDAHTGSFAARINTDTYGTALLPGILLSGEFDLLQGVNGFTRGQAYTGRPTNFEGWYKYAPANGDSAAIAVQLTRWNAATQVRDTVGEVGIIIRNAAASWTQFVLPIVYYNNDTPDTLVVVATSSADGANFNGASGSELLIDDFDLRMATDRAEAQAPLLASLAQQDAHWVLRVPQEPSKLVVRDLQGRPVLVRRLPAGVSEVATAAWPAGLYVVSLEGRSGRHWHQKVALIR